MPDGLVAPYIAALGPLMISTRSVSTRSTIQPVESVAHDKVISGCHPAQDKSAFAAEARQGGGISVQVGAQVENVEVRKEFAGDHADRIRQIGNLGCDPRAS